MITLVIVTEISAAYAIKAIRERRDQLRHSPPAKPQLVATAPNQTWSWDITKLIDPRKWTY
jgi:putative transposase